MFRDQHNLPGQQAGSGFVSHVFCLPYPHSHCCREGTGIGPGNIWLSKTPVNGFQPLLTYVRINKPDDFYGLNSEIGI
jgi:hypothetical protein